MLLPRIALPLLAAAPLAALLWGCASAPSAPAAATPVVAPTPAVTESQSQDLTEAAPVEAPMGPEEGLGSYSLSIDGKEGLELTIQSDGEGLTAECRGARLALSGSVEGGGGAPLTVSLMGLSDRTEQPVAIRLMSDGASADTFTGVAVVERDGHTSSVRFVASRRRDGAAQVAAPTAAPKSACGDLLWSHKSLYHGPAGTDELVTRRFEHCTEQARPDAGD